MEGVAKREFSSLGLNILDFMSGLSPSLNLLSRQIYCHACT